MGGDNIRREDSYLAFKEVLATGVTSGADMVLLGGDLFHDNKPSRGCIHRAITLLRQHCLGDSDVAIQMCSDQGTNFRGDFRRVNYEDPNFNIGLPVFSIHGNHDDPTREGGLTSLSANDILSAANLVNYFGTSEHLDSIKIYPLLITKGNTRLALYGLGAMRDERLNRMFTKGKVTFVRPSGDVDPWFSVFVVHQNRDKGRGPKNCVHESMIPSWMDVVVWGHEHECLIEPQESSSGYFITQPGSTVATSLVEGEAVKKHICTLDIRLGDKKDDKPLFKLTSIPMTMVRPFIMEEIDLSFCEELESVDPNDPQVGDIISTHLQSKVNAMIERAKDEHDLKDGFPGMLGRDKEGRVLPLIRLRVFRGQHQTLNVQRFGSQYLGSVANPKSMLQFARKKQAGAKGGRKRRLGGVAFDADDTGEFDMNDAGASKARVSEIVSRQLADKSTKLTLLPERGFTDAVDKFVEKEDNGAIGEFVEATLAKMQRSLVQDGDGDLFNDAEKFEKSVAKRTEKTDKALRAKHQEHDKKAKKAKKKEAKRKKKNKNKGKKRSRDSDDSDDASSSSSSESEEDDEDSGSDGDEDYKQKSSSKKKKKTATSSKNAAAAKKSQQKLSFSRQNNSDDDSASGASDEDEDDDDDGGKGSSSSSSKSKSKSKAISTKRKRSAAPKKKVALSKSRKKQEAVSLVSSSDDDSDGGDDGNTFGESMGSQLNAKTANRRSNAKRRRR